VLERKIDSRRVGTSQSKTPYSKKVNAMTVRITEVSVFEITNT